ncbi:3-methylcrotonyl-CoA carboxylase beta subunit, partial [Tremellales sp. Uapishka_1]
MAEQISALDALREKTREGGGREVLDKWRAKGKGKLSVRERVDMLLDSDSPFVELSPLAGHEVYEDEIPGAGLVTGIGMVAGRKCMIVANDPTVKGGAYYPLTVKKHLRAQEIALENRLPCIYLVESGGAALPYQAQVFPDHDHFGRIFYNMARMSGLGIPQVSVVHGISVAGGAYMPAMSDVVIIVKVAGSSPRGVSKAERNDSQNQGRIFLAGPPLVKAATGEIIDDESLGGGEMHTSVSGVADHLATSDSHAIRLAREAILDLGSPCSKLVKQRKYGDDAIRETRVKQPIHPVEDLNAIIPSDGRKAFDMREIIARVVDGSEFREFKKEYGKTIITGFAEIHGYTVGIIANAGVLLSNSALKATHFIQLCSQRSIPLVFLVNVSGYMVGEKAEKGGIAKDGAKMVRAVARAKVPKFTIVVGGTYGAGNYERHVWESGKSRFSSIARKWTDTAWQYSPRFLFMWPNSKICVMGPDQLSSVMQSVSGKRPDRYKDLKSEIETQSSALYSTARIWDDGIIHPSDTRDILGLGLELAADEREGRKMEGSREGDGGDWGVFRM